MTRVWGHIAAGVSLLAGAGVTTAACVHDDSTLFVQDVLAAPFVTQGQECTFNADPTQPFISQGVLDIDFRDEYTAEFLLGNQMVAEANSQQLQTETSTITIQGAVVRITDASGAQLNTFTRLAAATVYPSSGTTPGYTPIGLTIIDANTIRNNGSLQTTVAGGGRSRLVTYVKFFGNTLGGKSVESDEFEFPVDVCKGCLITFTATDINPNASFPNCLGNGTSTSTTSLPAPCVPGQDFPIDCSQCLTIPDCNPNSTTLVTDAGTGG
jgi:hypothetical protein